MRFLLAFFLALSASSVQAQSGVSEYGLKAVLLFKLPQFAYWPQSEQPPAAPTLCVLGSNPFGGLLQQLARNAGGQGDVRMLDSRAAIGGCDVLFISRSESAQIDSLLQRPEIRRTLTVSDIPGFARGGGMVELVLTGETVGVALNRKAAQRNGFDFNAQLLRLAQKVEP